jgi:hypothetical protein
MVTPSGITAARRVNAVLTSSRPSGTRPPQRRIALVEMSLDGV